MIIEVEIPHNTEVERKLLGALLLMLPDDRDAAVKQIATVWFFDQWNQRFFNVLFANRRRDFNAEMLAAMKSHDGASGKTAWWISQLFLDRAGEPATNVRSWKEYAAVLQRCHKMRCEILTTAEMLKDKINAYRIESYAVCDPSKPDAEVHDKAPRRRTNVVLDGIEIA